MANAEKKAVNDRYVCTAASCEALSVYGTILRDGCGPGRVDILEEQEQCTMTLMLQIQTWMHGEFGAGASRRDLQQTLEYNEVSAVRVRHQSGGVGRCRCWMAKATFELGD